MSSVSTLVDQLKRADGEALQKVLYELAVQMASGDSAISLCAELRSSGAVLAVISNLLTHEVKQIHQLAINLVGSLAATALDPHADLSRRELKQAGAFDHLLRHLLTTKDDTTLLYALIAIQNMCTDIESVDKLKGAGGVAKLQHIIGLADPQLLEYAQGCLANVRIVKVLDTMQQRVSRTKANSTKVLEACVRNWRTRRAARAVGNDAHPAAEKAVAERAAMTEMDEGVLIVESTMMGAESLAAQNAEAEMAAAEMAAVEKAAAEAAAAEAAAEPAATEAAAAADAAAAEKAAAEKAAAEKAAAEAAAAEVSAAVVMVTVVGVKAVVVTAVATEVGTTESKSESEARVF